MSDDSDKIISNPHFIFNEIITYFVPGFICIALFLLSDAEFFGCNIYSQLKIGVFLKECTPITITSTVGGLIIFLVIPYFLGHIIYLLSSWITSFGLSRCNCFLKCIFADDVDKKFPAEIKEKISSKKNNNNNVRMAFLSQIYYSCLESKKHISWVIFKYRSYYRFMRSISLILLVVPIIFFIIHFFPPNSNVCQSCVCQPCPDLKLNGTGSNESNKGVCPLQNESSKSTAIGKIVIAVLIMYLISAVISFFGYIKYYRKYIKLLLYLNSEK